MTNHLGNVLNVITDHKLPNDGINNDLLVDNFTADVVSYSDYYPFGMEIKSRNGNEEDYRYGFNGMEKDDEIKGEGNSYDFGARIYDPRIGRWMSADPMEPKHPDLATYSNVANSPLMYLDYNGEDFWIFIEETTKTNSGHAAIAVEEYTLNQETKEFTKTGRIIVYENYPRNLGDIDGADPVDGMIKKTIFNSIDDYINQESCNMIGVEGGNNSGHDYEMIQIKTDAKEDYKAMKYGDLVQRNMEKAEGEAGKMYYDPKDYSCSGFVAHVLTETKYKDDNDLGAQEVSFKFKGVPISTQVITPNKLFNDLLNKLGDIIGQSSTEKMDEEAAGKYVETYANQ